MLEVGVITEEFWSGGKTVILNSSHRGRFVIRTGVISLDFYGYDWLSRPMKLNNEI